MNTKLLALKHSIPNHPTPPFRAISAISSVHSKDLEQRVSEALIRIPKELDKLLTSRFGLGCSTPLTAEEQAQKDDTSVEEVEENEAQALRLLMGYGK